MDKVNVFNKEYTYIKNELNIEDCKVLIGLLPDYFFEVPASSTGKYHPSFTLLNGGLVRHVKAAVRIAYDLLYNASIGNVFNDNEKDLIIIALLLHDGLKSGFEKSEYTVFDHPILIKKFILENKNKLNLDSKNIELLTSMIESHMGEWNTNKFSKVVLPLPSNKYQKFVHMCDYLASRKYLDIKFEDNNIVD